MSARRIARNERGIALIVVMLLVLALSAMALGTAMVMMNSGLIRRYAERAEIVEGAALAGLEEGRSRLNGTKTLFPDSGYVTLENGVAVTDATGATIPGLKRWTYAGPAGITSGQYGLSGAIISVVEDKAKIRTVRRLEVNQESFAKYAYFTDIEPSDISFGNTDEINGPVHTNDYLKIYAPSGNNKARFHGPVTTAKTVQVPSYGTFDKGYTEHVAVIPMPQIQDLTKLKAQATAGNLYFAGNTSGGYGQASLRIEFVAVDLNNDGDAKDLDEGFIRVYRGNDPAFVVASRTSPMESSLNCGDSTDASHKNTGPFLAAGDHVKGSKKKSGNEAASASLNASDSRCYLGGDPVLTNGWMATTTDGSWLKWPGKVDPRVTATGRPDSLYLFPLSYLLNAGSKGVIYVDGKVAISGTVNGKVTLASPNSIIIVDDVLQANPPGNDNCSDILGLLAGQDVIVADNSINAPILASGNGNNYKTRDATPDPISGSNAQGGSNNNQSPNSNEFVQAVVLALNIFTVENYDDGPDDQEKCEDVKWGRGCLYLTGGIIQKTRGAVGTTAGTGNLKRYDYNSCAFTDPPPYFPTTGHFSRNRVYPMDPTGFNVATWFANNQH